MQTDNKHILKAIVIVVLVHLAIIFAIYINYQEDNKYENNEKSLVTYGERTSNSYQNIDLGEPSEAMMTLTEAAETASLEKESENDVELTDNAVSKDKPNAKLEKSTDKELLTKLEKENDLASTENTSFNNRLKNETHAPSEIRSVYDNNEISIKDDVILLSRDLPQSSANANNAVLDDVAQIKLEVERINEELSTVINEVKKRNQQQIEQREHEKMSK